MKPTAKSYDYYVDRSADALSTAVIAGIVLTLCVVLSWIAAAGFVLGVAGHAAYYGYRAFKVAA